MPCHRRQLLQHKGNRYDGFIPLHFRRALIGYNEYDPVAARAPFHQLFVYLNSRMVANDASTKRRHNWESKWFNWICNWRGVSFYPYGDGDTQVNDGVTKRLKTQICFIGNVVFVPLVLPTVTLFTVAVCTSARYRRTGETVLKPSPAFKHHVYTGDLLVMGWCCNLLPYVLVDRAAFLYHYLPGMF